MSWRSAQSISTRLTMMNMLVSGAALVLACTAFFLYDQVTFRQGLIRTLSAQAQIVGSNSVSALMFNDPQSATNTLSGLSNSRHITSAGILLPDGHPFAEFTKTGAQAPAKVPVFGPNEIDSYSFKSTHATLVHKILFQGKLVGYVYIRADLGEITARLWRYTVIAAGVLLISLTFALLVSSAFRRSVARPIVALAETARAVTREKDYSVRVPATRPGDEIALLIDSFNEMLAQIQQRDKALQKARDELEQRISERTRDLVSANQELEAFSYSVSHDLRGPLDAIIGFSYVLLSSHAAKLDITATDSLKSIRAAARRMSELIDDLLNLSRVTTSTMHRERIDLSEFARTIMEELCRSAPERKLDFVAPTKAETFADARLSRIVIDNLLRNAWKYTSHHEHARIEFGERHAGGRTIYFVRDDGSGFDPRLAERLFQPFQRLHAASEFPGNGIGLATVRRIVQRHGGEVWAEGAVEQGATFYFTLEPRSAR